jgi:glycosyltransferase involved in cell wall biosynthesis
MACGTPVIVGNNSSLPEVVGEAGLRIDVSREEAIFEALLAILGDSALRARLSRAGLLQAERFSWEACARKTLAAYELASLRDERERA